MTRDKYEEVHPSMSGAQVYFRLLSQLKLYWSVFLLSILGLMLFSSMEILSVDLFGYTINTIAATSGDSAELPAVASGQGSGITSWLVGLLSDDVGGLGSRFIIPLVMFGIVVVRGIGFFVGSYCMSYVTQYLVHNLRIMLFNKYTRLPSHYFDQSMSGHLVSRVTFHVAQVTQAATGALKTVFRAGSLVIGLVFYLFYLNWRLAIIFLLVLPVIGILVGLVSKRFRTLSRRIQASVGDVTQVTQESVSGYREMRLFGGEDYERKRMFRASNYNRRQQMKLAVAEGLSTPVIQMLVGASLSVLVWMALSPEVLTDMSGGEFVQFLLAAGLMAKPIRQLSEVNSIIQRGVAAAGTIFTTLDEGEETDLGTIEKPRVRGDFEFRGVSFSYDGEQPVLNDINFSVAAGESVALVGASGSGKTTLVSLIPRFYRHTQGEILLDGVDVNDYTLANLRDHVALVSQNVTLFNDTIYNNIAYGELAGRSEEEVRAAARAAHALGFIEQLPEGFKTVVGDDGVMLSGGQRQRLAIARALLKDAPVLILDEATSALDTESEHHIQAALEGLMKGRTTFVIAHRLSTVENCDRILVLEQGRIVEQGSHRTLLESGGRYASLYRKQFTEQREDS